jgi:hypothetical protein
MHVLRVCLCSFPFLLLVVCCLFLAFGFWLWLLALVFHDVNSNKKCNYGAIFETLLNSITLLYTFKSRITPLREQVVLLVKVTMACPFFEAGTVGSSQIEQLAHVLLAKVMMACPDVL